MNYVLWIKKNLYQRSESKGLNNLEMFDCQKGINNLVLPMEMSCCYNSLIDNNFAPIPMPAL